MPSKATNKLDTSVRIKVGGKAAPAPKAALGNWAKITVGSVEVNVRIPTPVELKKRVKESKSVASRLRGAIARPGVKLNVKATTPIYSADMADTTLIVRKVGAQTTRGRFNNNGVFVKVK